MNPSQVNDWKSKILLNSIAVDEVFCFFPLGRFGSGGGHYPCKHWQRDGREGWGAEAGSFRHTLGNPKTLESV